MRSPRFSRIATNGITLHIAEAGPAQGPLLFLLHGFPEFWYGWRNQIGPLADHGFHVVAPDLRGYNLSDKPKKIEDYDLDLLAADVAGLATHFGQERFDVAGHDWGATIAWWVAGKYADRVRRIAVLNAPHPAVWVGAMRHHPEQKRKSSYVRLFRMRHVPELLIRLGGPTALAKGFRDSIRPGSFTDADLEEYRRAWSQAGFLTASINYYRAVLKKAWLPPDRYRIDCPTLILWGKRDAYAVPELAEASAGLCSNARLVYLDRATHWVQHDEPDRVTQLLSEFFQ